MKRYEVVDSLREYAKELSRLADMVETHHVLGDRITSLCNCRRADPLSPIMSSVLSDSLESLRK